MKIGFIGLGIMGKPMAKNLLKAGYELNICDINKDAVADVAASGGRAYDTPGKRRQKAISSSPCFPTPLM